ncbi:hypothetical protein GH975_04755 [Litorivicinus lipolyticus]|uniref:DsrE/DsrF-like family protein n=1 Tax=Litorivicinus lipolyticus TaxID=418701 RepID=A0A5Q2QA97_9GAMM|nr:hypothetical protein [Litorivicinus lipolyticus]QGG79924.1 hypothetical protein GH975_04755 [Litorivicinus lipolyticus]
MTTLRLVIHAPTPEALDRGIRNLANFRRDQPGAEVELVVTGTAVRRAIALELDDPALRVCANSIATQMADVPADWETVPAAVSYLAQRQMHGWAYFRA